MSKAYIGLGSNLGQPRQQLLSALAHLAHLPHSRLVSWSGIWQSPPMGPPDQPDYLNAAALLDTELEPLVLLEALQRIEIEQHRVRSLRWGPRTLDLDLLVYEQLILTTERLQLPHPGIPQRDFVLQPLAQIDAQLSIPGQGQVQQLLDRLPPQQLNCRLLEEAPERQTFDFQVTRGNNLTFRDHPAG